ncbi:MAG: GntR family transcriptional regulator [Alphaproteobacteria bacterium]
MKPPNTDEESGKSPTLVAMAAEKIRAEILLGSYPPDSSLREIPLAEKFGYSRQTVRAALRSLAEMGLVELIARKGAVIPKSSPERTREIYSMRALIEPYALKTALIEGRVKSAELDAIDHAYNMMKIHADENNIAGLIESDMALHSALTTPCANHILLDFLQRLQAATHQSLVHMKVYGSDMESEVESHAPIIRAVHAKDPEAAANALKDHIIQNGERLMVMIVKNG